MGANAAMVVSGPSPLRSWMAPSQTLDRHGPYDHPSAPSPLYLNQAVTHRQSAARRPTPVGGRISRVLAVPSRRHLRFYVLSAQASMWSVPTSALNAALCQIEPPTDADNAALIHLTVARGSAHCASWGIWRRAWMLLWPGG